MGDVCGVVNGKGNIVWYFFVLIFGVEFGYILGFFIGVDMDLVLLMIWVDFSLNVIFGILDLVDLVIDGMVEYVEVVCLFVNMVVLGFEEFLYIVVMWEVFVSFVVLCWILVKFNL